MLPLPLSPSSLLLLLLLLTLASTALAKVQGEPTDSSRTRSLQWAVAAASTALLAQRLLGPSADEEEEEAQKAAQRDTTGKERAEDVLVWREDDGDSKFVPMYPGKLGKAVSPVGEARREGSGWGGGGTTRETGRERGVRGGRRKAGEEGATDAERAECGGIEDWEEGEWVCGQGDKTTASCTASLLLASKHLSLPPPTLLQANGTSNIKLFRMGDVAKHNTRDDLWIIVDGLVYDVTRYVDRHPGGWLPLVNMAGKDCTDVFANYHGAKVYRTLLPAFLVGKVTDLTVPEHVKDFRAVRQELLRRGLFKVTRLAFARTPKSLPPHPLYFSCTLSLTSPHMRAARSD